jgi:hypothetical protein
MRWRSLCVLVWLCGATLWAADPRLTFSTYVGGNDNDQAVAVAADHAGNTIVTGPTTSPNFMGLPRSTSLSDGFVVKYDARGAVVFRMLIASSGFDVPTAVATDAHDNIYVTGYTQSSDFPVKNAFRATPAGNADGFLMKLSPGGEVIYSTYFGGTGIDEPMGVGADADGDAYVTGITNSPNLPLVNAAQTVPAAGVTTFVFKLSADGSALRYSTYLGGSIQDVGLAIDVDETGNAYVAGSTSSNNFPTTAGAFQRHLGGTMDAYLAKYDPNGALVFSTLFGGSGGEQISSVDVRNGGVYVAGATDSTDLPTHNPLMPIILAQGSGLAAKFTTAGELVYSTYLGSRANSVAQSIAANSRGEAMVMLAVTAGDLPTKNALQPAAPGLSDLYLVQLNAGGNERLFATYFGGAATDAPLGLDVDGTGRVVFCGKTTSRDLPVVNAAQPTPPGGPQDGFVASLQLSEPKPRAVRH